MEALADCLIAHIYRSRRAQFLTYIVLFCLAFFAASFVMILQGKGFIWADDGLEQQYVYFVYEGRWLREVLTQIFVNHSFILPQWDSALGYGSDAFVYASNTLGNPINLLSIFATAQTADLWLNATVPLTLFLAGCSFLRYGAYKHFDAFYTLIGALVYTFSAASLVMLTQIYLIYALVLAPIILRGADMIFDGKSPLSYVLAIFLTAASDVSQLYMTGLLLITYCVVRYWFMEGPQSIVSFVRWVIRFLIPTILGIAMAAVFFLPVTASILSQHRLELDRSSALLYTPSYYIQLFENITIAQSVGSECFFGIGAAGLIGVMASFTQIHLKQRRIIRVLFILFMVALCLPVVGRISNGMAYASNRWVWALSLVAGIAVAAVFKPLETAPSPIPRHLCYAVCGYIVLVVIAVVVFKTVLPDLSLMSAAKFLITSGVLLVLLSAGFIVLRPLYIKLLSCCVVLVGIATLYGMWEFALPNNHLPLGGSLAALTSAQPGIELVQEQPDHETSRYEASQPGKRNANVALGLTGTTFYNSYYNSNIDAYHTSLGLVSSPFNFSYSGLGSRTVLDAFAGVTYYLANNPTVSVPAQFDTAPIAQTTDHASTYSLYKNAHPLPTAFNAPKVIARSTYDAADTVSRQDLLTHGVVVDDEEPTDAEGTQPQSADTSSVSSNVAEHPYDLVGWSHNGSPLTSDANGCNLSATQAHVTQPNTTVYLSAELPTQSEGYLSIDNLSYTSDKTAQNNHDQSGVAALKRALWGTTDTAARDINLNVSTSNGSSTWIWQPTNQHDLYGGKASWAVRLPAASGRITVALLFSQPGTYTFSRLAISSLDTSATLTQLDTLAAAGAHDETWSTNTFSCTAQVPEATKETDTDLTTSTNTQHGVDNSPTGDADSHAGSYLMIRIPYGSGWHACVDGVDTPLIHADLGFMALRLSPGTHHIELRYTTPLLATGACFSVIGWLGYAGWWGFARRRSTAPVRDTLPQ